MTNDTLNRRFQVAGCRYRYQQLDLAQPFSLVEDREDGRMNILLKSLRVMTILILMIAVPALGQQDAAYWFYKGVELYNQNNFIEAIISLR